MFLRALFCASLLAVGVCGQREIRVVPIVEPRQAVLGEVVLYALDVRVVEKGEAEVEAPQASELPAIEGVEVLGSELIDRGRSQQTTIINGRVSNSTEFHWQLVYRLRPAEVGSYRIPQFSYSYLGESHAIRPLAFEVVREAPGNRHVQLAVSASEEAPYVNQPVRLRFVLTATKPINPNEVPEIEIPWATSAKGFSGAVPPPGWTRGRGTRVALNGETYDLMRERGRGEIVETLSFERTIYPLAAGQLDLGISRAKIEVATKVSRRGVFGARVLESSKAVLASPALVLTVRDAPLAARPKSYAGIIGDLEGRLELGETKIRAGNGVTLSLVLRGQGALETIPAPDLKALADLSEFDVYDPDLRVTGDGDERQLEIGWLLVPKAGVTEIPAIEISWFRPSPERFDSVSVEATPLEIVGEIADGEIFGGVAEARDARRTLALGEGMRPMKSEPGRIVSIKEPTISLWGLMALALAPVLSFALTTVLLTRRRRSAGDLAGQRRSRASKAARLRLAEVQGLLQAERGFHNQLARTLQGFVGDKLGLPPGRITAATAVSIVGEASGDESLAENFAEFLAELEAKEFGGDRGDESERRRDLSRAEDLIRGLDRGLGR
jgi:oxygen tolerance protein BatD